MHELSFLDADSELQRLNHQFERVTGSPLKIVTFNRTQLSLTDAVKSYLFNSQIVTPAHDPKAMMLICAAQCQNMPHVRKLIEGVIDDRDNPIVDVRYVSLDQSMSGGGGPACLRLRLWLPAEAVDKFAPAYRLTPQLMAQLEDLISNCYPERLDWDSLDAPECLEQYRRVNEAFKKVIEGAAIA